MAVIVNPNDPNNQQQQGIQTPTTAPSGAPLQTIGTAAPAGPTTPGQAPSKPQPQGSGRFTNIQKYLQANKQGGQQIAGQIGQTLQKQGEESQKQAQDYYSKLGQSVQQAGQVAQAGQGYQKQLQDIGSQIGQTQQAGLANRGQNLGGIEAFTQGPGFQQFQDIQAGRGINEGLLNLQQQRAAQAAQSAVQGSQQAQQNLGSEGGRFNLLKQQFGGGPKTGYTQGQQRLDQMLLGQGGGLNQLQAQTAQQLQANQAQSKLAQSQAGEVNRLAAQEQGLIGNLNQAAGANEQAYLNMLSSYGDPLQQQRNQEFQNLGQSLQSYVPTYNEKTGKYENKPYTPGLNEQQMTNLGLTDQNQGVYNVFKDEAFTKAAGNTDAERQQAIANAVASKGQVIRTGSPVETAQDVANKEDVTRYQNLAKIIGKDFVPQITQESQIGNAYNAKTGSEGLKERLGAAQEQFNKAALEAKPHTGNFNAGEARAANMQDVINKGASAYEVRDDTAPQWKNLVDVMEGRDKMYSPGSGVNNVQVATDVYNRTVNPYANKESWQNAAPLSKQFEDFINAQNYNQTLGGQRQTYLDTLANQNMQDKGIAPKINAAPVTGVDPAIAYKQALLAGLAKKGVE